LFIFILVFFPLLVDAARLHYFGLDVDLGFILIDFDEVVLRKSGDGAN
jgi:hypothetical protein